MTSSDSSGFGDSLAEFMAGYERLYNQLFWREVLGLDDNDQPRNGGFTGILGILDEVPEFAFWSQRPMVFTPSEFKQMWDSYTEDQKFNYVLSLIS